MKPICSVCEKEYGVKTLTLINSTKQDRCIVCAQKVYGCHFVLDQYVKHLKFKWLSKLTGVNKTSVKAEQSTHSKLLEKFIKHSDDLDW